MTESPEQHSTAALPDDVGALKAVVLEQAREHQRALEQHEAALRHERAQGEERAQIIARRDATISQLQEQINLLLARRYGASAEAVSQAQLKLFNEAEHEGETEQEEPHAGNEVKAHRRQRPRRLALPEHLARVDIEHGLSDEQRLCPRRKRPAIPVIPLRR